jgi:hypothetical protein
MLRGALTGVLSHSKYFSMVKVKEWKQIITGAITTIVALLVIHM